jgi:hypothetical protein
VLIADRGLGCAAPPQRYTRRMNSIRALLVAIACAVPVVCIAQWQWVDKDGRKVFSDQPPPADVPAKNILKQPSGTKGKSMAYVDPTPAAAASAPAKVAASAPKLSGKDKELEDKKKQAEAAAADKKKAQDEEVAKLRAENCTRAKRSKAEYDSGARIAQLNAKGEREFLDDAQRAAESKRLDVVIAADCKVATQ